MKTNVEILSNRLGEALARMTQLADKGDEAGALKEMAAARILLDAVRRAGGLADVSHTQWLVVEAGWKSMIRDRVRGAKAGV